MQIEWRLLIGLAASALIGAFALWRGSLTRSGALGAVIIGTTIFGFGGWAAGLTLIAFFASSSLLSHFKENNARKQRAAEMFEKGGQRDIWQVLANGGAAAMFAVVDAIVESFVDQRFPCGQIARDCVIFPSIWQIALFGALATVTADTWATELGVLSRSKPMSITTFKLVEPGTSGGISLLGVLSALIGASFIAILFGLRSGEMMMGGLDIGNLGFVLRIVFTAISGGLLGSLFDSFLGATVQAMYYSDARQKETEKAIERDGTPNHHLRGWKWMNNDWVNFISSLFGAFVSALLAILIFR